MRPALVVVMVTLASAAQLFAGTGLIVLTLVQHDGGPVLARAAVS